MRDLAEIGLSPENCELWFERAVLVFVGAMFIVIVLRVSVLSHYSYQKCQEPNKSPFFLTRVNSQLHLVVVVTNYYKQLFRNSRDLPSRLRKDTTLQRIYLLPPTSSSQADRLDPHLESAALVYAPVALGDLSEREVQGLNAREAWVHTKSSHYPPRQHRHSHARGHRHSSGRIVLPVQPGEPLIHGHEKYKD